MVMRELGLLAACFVLPISALDLKAIMAVPARATDKAEQKERCADGVSPKPTSRPELVGMELFKRDYTLPSDYCGWYADYKSASYTCALRSASCINVGSYRGCCNGQSLSCASTFYSTCIPGSKLTAGQSCAKSTLCCSGTNYPECGTILFSSRANPSNTYTNIDCWSSGYGSTYAMQDYPPFLTTDTTTTPTTSPSSTTTPTTTTTTPSPTPTTPTPTPTPEPGNNTSPPIAPIVGGVVGGVAVLGLLALGLFFILRRKGTKPNPPAPAPQNPQPPAGGPQMGQVGTPPVVHSTSMPPGYDPRYSYVQNYQVVSPDPNAGAFAQSPVGSPLYPSPTSPAPPLSPDPIKMAGSSPPVHLQAVNEAPATNPVGIGNNRAELA